MHLFMITALPLNSGVAADPVLVLLDLEERDCGCDSVTSRVEVNILESMNRPSVNVGSKSLTFLCQQLVKVSFLLR